MTKEKRIEEYVDKNVILNGLDKLITKYHEKAICNKVNSMLERKLSKYDLGACNVWYDKDKNGKVHTIVDVEFSDGVSGIDYELFLSKANNGKVSDEDFWECTW